MGQSGSMLGAREDVGGLAERGTDLARAFAFAAALRPVVADSVGATCWILCLFLLSLQLFRGQLSSFI